MERKIIGFFRLYSKDFVLDGYRDSDKEIYKRINHCCILYLYAYTTNYKPLSTSCPLISFNAFKVYIYTKQLSLFNPLRLSHFSPLGLMVISFLGFYISATNKVVSYASQRKSYKLTTYLDYIYFVVVKGTRQGNIHSVR